MDRFGGGRNQGDISGLPDKTHIRFWGKKRVRGRLDAGPQEALDRRVGFEYAFGLEGAQRGREKAMSTAWSIVYLVIYLMLAFIALEIGVIIFRANRRRARDAPRRSSLGSYNQHPPWFMKPKKDRPEHTVERAAKLVHPNGPPEVTEFDSDTTLTTEWK